MPKTEIADYIFTVKEGAPSEAAGEAQVSLMCEPVSSELSMPGNNGFLSIHLKDGTTVEEAQKISQYLQKHIKGISATTF